MVQMLESSQSVSTGTHPEVILMFCRNVKHELTVVAHEKGKYHEYRIVETAKVAKQVQKSICFAIIDILLA